MSQNGPVPAQKGRDGGRRRGLSGSGGVLATLNFGEFHFRDCPKSPRGVHSSALGATETMLFGPFCAPYTGHIHAQSVASTLFGQSLKVNSPKFASRILHRTTLEGREDGFCGPSSHARGDYM